MGVRIAIRGIEKGDFAYYIAKTLACNNKSVALIDNSFTKDLFEAVHQYVDNQGYVEKESMLFLKDVDVDDDFVEKFDYVIWYLGLNNENIPADFNFMISDYRNATIHQIMNMGDIVKDSYFILRDKISYKISEKSLMLFLGITEEKMVGSSAFSDTDEIAYINFGYNGRQRIKDLSSDMQYAIMSAVALVTGETLDEVKKYYRKAKRNKRV